MNTVYRNSTMSLLRGFSDGYEWVFSTLRFTVFVFDFFVESHWVVPSGVDAAVPSVCVLDPMGNDEDKCRISCYFMIFQV